MNEQRRCTATTKAGRPCRGWAERGSHPPLCNVHGHPRAGAGNQNARKHGYYASTLSPSELADLVAAADTTTLADEVAITRITLRRLLAYLQDPELDPAEIKSVAPLVMEATGRIGRLLRDQQLLSGDAADKFTESLAGAVEILNELWGTEL